MHKVLANISFDISPYRWQRKESYYTHNFDKIGVTKYK